jgi:Zn-dependent protease
MSSNRPTISIKGRRGVRLASAWQASAAPATDFFEPSRSTFSGSLYAGRQHDGCVRLFALAGIPVRAHWSTLLLLGTLALTGWLIGPGPLCLALGVIAVMLTHEIGHACFARRMGYPAIEIRVYPLVAHCYYSEPYSEFEDAVIAWGGVAAQMLLLVPAAVAFAILGNTPFGVLNVMLFSLTYVNAIMIALNLIPAPGLDGRRAWKLPFMLARAKLTVRALRRSKVLL